MGRFGAIWGDCTPKRRNALTLKGLRGGAIVRGKNRRCNLLSFNDLEKSDVFFW